MAPDGTVNGDHSNESSHHNWSQSQYGLSRQKLNEIFKALRDCGIEEVIKLPKIAVIGNQSAGKSSLIEAISGIKVPRAAGTCTRCPMEVILLKGHPSVQWRAKLSLRIEQCDIDGQQLGVFEFGETTEPNEVTLLLQRAQLAILNPDRPFLAFSELKSEECTLDTRRISFSSNTIVLEISGAGTDLTFIDLPGIIANTDKVSLSQLPLTSRKKIRTSSN
jgi:GTPase SAR1 family protein